MIQFQDQQSSVSLIKVAINTVLYPVGYAKVLIQIGYEPMLPRPTTTILFRKPALALPNIFEYVNYIKKVDGISGCYRGVVPTICADIVGSVVFNKTSNYIKKAVETEEEEETKEDKQCTTFICELIQGLISRTVAVLFSHPLEVIALRMMAQFVGKETKYSGLFGSFVEVYKENGISGYYAGLMPKLIGITVIITLFNTTSYIIGRYILTDEATKPYVLPTVNFIATTAAYPFWVVSHCMAVNNCGLVAGLPPHMPIYNGWRHCWSHLSATNQLKRGNSMFWRYHTGQQIMRDGKPAVL